MEQLKTFQRQFEAAANQFLGMIHLIKWFRIPGIESKHKVKSEPERLGFLPLSIVNQASHKAVEVPLKYKSTRKRQIDYWISDAESSYDQYFYETHWLLRPEDCTWDKAQALATLNTLAKSAAIYIVEENKNPIISNIWAEIGTEIISATFDKKYVQGWLLVVRLLQPAQTIKRMFDAKHNSLSAAEEGKPCFSTIDDVFLQSALACSELLERTKATPSATDNSGDKVETGEPSTTERSLPLSWKQWADVFGMSTQALRDIREADNPTYHFSKTREKARKWTLPMNELPAEYLLKYQKVTR